MVLSSSHVGMWELAHKEGWTHKIDVLKLWCWRRHLRILWLTRTSDQSIPKGMQQQIFIGRTNAEAEAAILWSPDAKSWLIGKDCNAGKDWEQKEMGMTEDEMVGWHHWFNGHEFEQAPGDGEEQGSLACCSLWGHKESDMTERLNNKNNSLLYGQTLTSMHDYWKNHSFD